MYKKKLIFFNIFIKYINKIMTTINSKNKIMKKNELVELMEKLSKIMITKDEPFRAKAYQKAKETIMNLPGDISAVLNIDDLKGKPNIGASVIEKLNEYVLTGTLELIEKEKNNPVNIFTDVYGIGIKKAIELVNNGITNIQQLRDNQDKLLNDKQKIGLKYYEDILKRIPRTEILHYNNIFKNIFEKVLINNANNYKSMEIVGSFRRGAKDSGDIDVIITSTSHNNFINFIDVLIENKVILHVLSRGESKCLVVAQIPSSTVARRVDFLYTTPEEFPFAILYFTGSKIFNTVMRNHALSKGFTMNEHGISHKKGDKVSHIFKTEKDIFEFLNLQYKSPNERIDGNAVIIQNKDSNYNLVENFKKHGISILEKLNITELYSLLKEANDMYYNDVPIMTDNEFDVIQEYTTDKFSKDKKIDQFIGNIGAPLREVVKNKVKLPYFMGSMNKIKPDTQALTSWCTKYNGPYVISCKLDGVSGLYTTEGNKPKLYTRGDGIEGQDVSHLIPYLFSFIPDTAEKMKNIVIRGEFIMTNKIFNDKYKTLFSNPRNLVAGIVNRIVIDEKINDIDFVAYEVIKPILKPSDQMKLLEYINVKTVFNENVSIISNNFLSQKLINCRNPLLNQYQIDGIIVSDDHIYERKNANPDNSFAFKMVLSDQIAEAKVVNVIWTPSKHGYLKPRVQIQPINLGGVCIEFATGFNGAFIYDNKIGVGSIIEIIRSGDVIPHIRKITVPCDTPLMPSVPFIWNDSHVDIMLQDISTDLTVKEKNIIGFFRGIGVEGLSSGNVSRIVSTGFDTVIKIINMSINDFLTVEGFQSKMANKLHQGIKDKLNNASIVSILSSCNLFGRGFSNTKIQLIIQSYPDIIVSNETNELKKIKISSIKGMSDKTADLFLEGIPMFLIFLKESGLNYKLLNYSKEDKIIDNTNPLYGKTIVMSGFRDEKIINYLKNNGSKLGTSVSKNTFILIVKDLQDDSVKVNEARKHGVPIMTSIQFINQF